MRFSACIHNNTSCAFFRGFLGHKYCINPILLHQCWLETNITYLSVLRHLSWQLLPPLNIYNNHPASLNRTLCSQDYLLLESDVFLRASEKDSKISMSLLFSVFRLWYDYTNTLLGFMQRPINIIKLAIHAFKLSKINGLWHSNWLKQELW